MIGLDLYAYTSLCPGYKFKVKRLAKGYFEGIEGYNQKKERRLTALMVMSSIESFARSIDESAEVWDRLDSLLNHH